MKGLAEIIWNEVGFRFHHRTTNSSLRFYYHCCQDQAYERELDGPRIRDAPKMTRYPCHSSLIMYPQLDERILTLELQHRYHQPYVDRARHRERVRGGNIDLPCARASTQDAEAGQG